ncbi:MAG: FTR1 family protein [Sulfuricella sp.]|nr:FTR1 family protein [Sulfuricella sp.]
MGSALFIVWRESIEAILVIGILYAWLNANGLQSGLRWLWGGVTAGVALAALLGGAMLLVQSQLAGDALEWFQIAMEFIAAVLITQMVLWMRKHGKNLKGELEAELGRAMNRANRFGVALVAALAVGREGAETAIFLYGLGLERSGNDLALFAAAGCAGLILALISGWALVRGGRRISTRTFFRVTEIILLLLAAALLVNGTEKLVGLGVVPALIDPLWDSAFLLDDSAGIGGFLAQLTGYRARPSLTTLLAFGLYWLAVSATLRRPARVKAG